MCGIVGYVGRQNAADVLINGLTNLEYRGYDSAGITLAESGILKTIKMQGRLDNLIREYRKSCQPPSHCGIGHTRWATHGAPSGINSHPHGTDRLSLVHNGIIENYLQIKEFLKGKGYTFLSETDTEAAARLLDYFYHGDPVAALRQTLAMLEGSYAFGVVFADFPQRIYAVRKDSPLIVATGQGENFIASDVPAILQYTRDYYLLDELEIAVIDADTVAVQDLEGNAVNKEKLTAHWDIAQAQKSGYPHFMLKEIHQQPKALMDTLHPRISGNAPSFADDGLPEDFFRLFNKVVFVACGTAMYAGTVGKTLMEKLARVPTEVDCASEFRYRNPILNSKTLVILVSQSGETADTLAALRLAKSAGAVTLAIVNMAGSSMSREADYILHTYAGPEIAVASTKAFSVQIALLYLVSIRCALEKGRLNRAQAAELTGALLSTVQMVPAVLADTDAVLRELSGRFVDAASLFYMGRGIDYAMAMEGSLKLKEISYIHSEAYAAGELKHGTISLITDGVPVVGLVTQRELLPKTISNIKEARARGGHVLLIAQEGLDIDPAVYDDIVWLPAVPEDCFAPILSVIALQLLAYHVAVVRGCDIDKPRNLAKSVTVE